LGYKFRAAIDGLAELLRRIQTVLHGLQKLSHGDKVILPGLLRQDFRVLTAEKNEADD
jgi:hypothetical protein